MKQYLHEFNSLDEFFEAKRTEKRGYSIDQLWNASIVLLSIFIASLILMVCSARAETWTATAYCGCVQCCGKSDCITASGKRAVEGVTVACNWLKFGTPIYINGNKYTVQDRGAKSIFGTKTNPKKRVDIYMLSHKDALIFGRQKVDVII